MSVNQQLPERIQLRLENLNIQVDQIVSAASALITIQLPGALSLRIENAAPRDFLTSYERAQSISFITRFDQLPTDYTVQIVHREGEFYIENLSFLRHVLNDFRPLIMNQSDSTYYQNIHRVWYGMLTLGDPAKGTTIRAINEAEIDATAVFTSWLSQHNQAITLALRPLDFDYLYNGVLQHSGEEFSDRFLRDYTSGELNYVLWKHAHILGFIRRLLLPYYQVARWLTCPRVGAL